MIFTNEQLEIINSKKQDIIVNAGPGMGKTTLLLGIVQNHTEEEKRKVTQILCFNKMIKEEINKKLYNMKNYGIATVNTFHSLAYHCLIEFSNKTTIKSLENRTGASLDYFFVKKSLEAVRKDIKFTDDEIVTITGLLTEYCKSDLLLNDFLENSFFKLHPKYIIYFRNMIEEVSRFENLQIPHEYYMKEFQILLKTKKIKLNVDYLLVDEFQDVSPCYMSIIKDLNPKRVVKVGDTLQKIYGYNGAIGISSFDYKLSQSFRIGNDNAELCNNIVKRFTDNEKLFIKGINKNQKIEKIPKNENKVIIFRTNENLIKRLFVEVLENKKICAVPSSLVDDIWQSYSMIEKAIKVGYFSYKGIKLKGSKDFKKYIKLSNDNTLKFIQFVMTRYKEKALDKLKELRSKVTRDLTRTDIDILITAHKCKGMEFPNVELANDFPNISDIEIMKEKGQSYLDELCVLYVALTRSNRKLQLNDDLIQYYKNGGEN